MDLKIGELVIAMSLSDVPIATKNAGFISAQLKNAGAPMMLWPMRIGSALIFLMTSMLLPFHS